MKSTAVQKYDFIALKEKAKQIRRHILEMTYAASSGHPGGSMSIADIVTVLYFAVMRYDPQNPAWEERDRFVLSKGHGAPALYSALAEAGFFPTKELKTLRKCGTRLEGHPSHQKVPGVEASTGSLGQGFSMSVGMALAAKIDKKENRVYALLGDGECNEGIVWEAAMAANHYKLDNLTAIVDRNHYQIDGVTEDVMSLEPFADKWRGFGWNTVVIDGHNLHEIFDALERAESTKGKPTVIIANTLKGKGVSFMEGKNDYHGKPLPKELLDKALEELA
ncbi:1-deoxy-D-xylulose-5-phosphate synthase [uncultured archaeon]|nr:1-deoxy-D-xylulose-5-phosphate synthase [uncultured archaeon]